MALVELTEFTRNEYGQWEHSKAFLNPDHIVCIDEMQGQYGYFRVIVNARIARVKEGMVCDSVVSTSVSFIIDRSGLEALKAAAT